VNLAAEEKFLSSNWVTAEMRISEKKWAVKSVSELLRVFFWDWPSLSELTSLSSDFWAAESENVCLSLTAHHKLSTLNVKAFKKLKFFRNWVMKNSM